MLMVSGINFWTNFPTSDKNVNGIWHQFHTKLIVNHNVITEDRIVMSEYTIKKVA